MTAFCKLVYLWKHSRHFLLTLFDQSYKKPYRLPRRVVHLSFFAKFCGHPVYFVKERRSVLNLALNVIPLYTHFSCEIKRIIRGIVANYKYQDHRFMR